MYIKGIIIFIAICATSSDGHRPVVLPIARTLTWSRNKAEDKPTTLPTLLKSPFHAMTTSSGLTPNILGKALWSDICYHISFDKVIRGLDTVQFTSPMYGLRLMFQYCLEIMDHEPQKSIPCTEYCAGIVESVYPSIHLHQYSPPHLQT